MPGSSRPSRVLGGRFRDRRHLRGARASGSVAPLLRGLASMNLSMASRRVEGPRARQCLCHKVRYPPRTECLTHPPQPPCQGGMAASRKPACRARLDLRAAPVPAAGRGMPLREPRGKVQAPFPRTPFLPQRSSPSRVKLSAACRALDRSGPLPSDPISERKAQSKAVQ
jgi:hypothetical protein